MADATTPRPRERSATESAIRTMRSDVSEFLKTTTPSLVSILARQAEWDETRATERPRRWVRRLALGGVALTVLVIGGYLSYTATSPGASPGQPGTPAAPSEPFIRYEAGSGPTIAKTRGELLAALVTAARNADAVGAFRRIALDVKTDLGIEPLGLAQFLGLASANLPAGFLESVEGAPQIFVYRQASGPVFGFAILARNANRAMAALHDEEPSLIHDLAVLFPLNAPSASLDSFTDRTYRNVDYRYLNLDAATGRGIGYLHFPARRLIVMATSEESLTRIIDRLFAH